jgi:hypothetical protein
MANKRQGGQFGFESLCKIPGLLIFKAFLTAAQAFGLILLE